MTSASGTTERAAASGQAPEAWTIRALFAGHKAVGIGALSLLALLVAITVVAILASGPLVVSDSSTCTDWGSANYTQQRTYARLFVREHRSLPGGARDPASVVAAINLGCTQAYANDVQDGLTVVQAIGG